MDPESVIHVSAWHGKSVVNTETVVSAPEQHFSAPLAHIGLISHKHLKRLIDEP